MEQFEDLKKSSRDSSGIIAELKYKIAVFESMRTLKYWQLNPWKCVYCIYSFPRLGGKGINVVFKNNTVIWKLRDIKEHATYTEQRKRSHTALNYQQKKTSAIDLHNGCESDGAVEEEEDEDEDDEDDGMCCRPVRFNHQFNGFQ